MERHGGRVNGIVGPWHGDDWRTARPIAPYHKGDGHVTDDTLMTHALIRVYATVRDHLDAYAVADHLVPDLISTPRWIPELEAEALPLQRVFLAEKWIVARLHYGHVDPREAGVGNIVNCGAAMYMAPVGLVNAADSGGPPTPRRSTSRAPTSPPTAARRRASSRRRSPRPARRARHRDSVVDACLSLAKDGTQRGDRGGLRSGRPARGLRVGARPAARRGRARSTRSARTTAHPSLGARRPSRLHSIEELPVALGMLLVGGGDYRHTVLGAVNYGRDCDSIATMAGAIAGALRRSAGPRGLGRRRSPRPAASTCTPPARTLAEVAREVFARDVERRRAHEAAFAALAERHDGCSASPGSSPRTCSATNCARRPRTAGTPRAIAARWNAAGGRDGPAPRGRVRPARRRRSCAPLAERPAGRTGRLPSRWRTTSRPTWTTITAACPGWPARAARTRRARAARARPAWKRPGSAAPSAACSASPSRSSRCDGIRALARATGNWPLDHLVHRPGPARPTRSPPTPGTAARAATSLAENIDGMPEDDDLNYPLLTLLLLQRHGSGFTTADVARLWLDELPAGRTFTAERVAYRNLLAGIEPPHTARHRNPFREWIGALIRADVHGWTHPGDPAAAAEQAHRDAGLTHTANGVYGAMFTAAAIAAAARPAPPTCTTLPRGRAHASSRRAPASPRPSASASDSARAAPDFDTVVDQLHAAHGHHHWVHAVPNAALIAAALTHADGDFTGSICRAVSGGWDTDSNGATAGSLAGLLAGSPDALPDRWTAPLKNRLATSVAGFDGIGFDTLAHLHSPTGGTPPMTAHRRARQHQHGPRRLRRQGPAARGDRHGTGVPHDPRRQGRQPGRRRRPRGRRRLDDRRGRHRRLRRRAARTPSSPPASTPTCCAPPRAPPAPRTSSSTTRAATRSS